MRNTYESWRFLLAGGIIRTAAAAGWNVQKTKQAIRTRSSYIQLEHPVSGRRLLVRLSDHPPRRWRGEFVSIEYPETKLSRVSMLIRKLRAVS